jgi:hypothetical protein
MLVFTPAHPRMAAFAHTTLDKFNSFIRPAAQWTMEEAECVKEEPTRNHSSAAHGYLRSQIVLSSSINSTPTLTCHVSICSIYMSDAMCPTGLTRASMWVIEHLTKIDGHKEKHLYIGANNCPDQINSALQYYTALYSTVKYCIFDGGTMYSGSKNCPNV